MFSKLICSRTGRGAYPEHARPEQHGEDKCRNSGSQVHHKAAGKIENAPLRKPAPASHPMGDRHVDEKKPKEGEQKHSAKAHG